MCRDLTEDMSFDERDFRGNGNGMLCPPIAIVGIGCRFPGGVTDPRSYWRLLQDGIDAITEIPSDRIDIGTYYDPRPAQPGKMSTKWGGFLNQIEMFDAAFFGISPREADRLDPQQRLLMEVAWEALEDAGQPSERLAGSLTGVFLGLWLNDYEARLFADPAAVDFYMTTGTGRYSASGRLSYVLGLEGPSLTIDTACSSSLVAVHLACQSLRRNECSLALAGGANIILQPHISIAYSQSRMMAPDGRCKFGDARANGYVRSEGAGIVVLKPLSKALADGDPVYAVIRGSAVNNDGRTSGYMTTPSRTGQERLLRLAYRDAGLPPSQVQYVEAHGTGTIAGDPVELAALGNVLSSDRPPGKTCYIGSVKTNFGHTEGAAGIAGLIKAALVLEHRIVPANLHLRELNPAIAWNDYPLVIPRELTHLAQDSELAVAGVSAFGIAGTNAHAVLTEAPRREQANEDARTHADRARVVTLSARSPEALASVARAYVSALEEEGGPSLYDVCYTSALRRTHHEHRLAVTAGNRAGASEHLSSFLSGKNVSWVSTGKAELESKPKVVFVCPGQGSQWVGMGRQLLREEAVFREWIQRCERALQPYVDWSLQAQLHLNPDTRGYRLNEIDVIQPVLFSIQVALAALWRSWGAEPDAIVGHSMGEVAAAFIAEALSLEDAARVICTRAMLLRRISGKGAMVMVALTVDQARECLLGFEDRVSVAVSNSSHSTVLSGDPSAVQEIIEKLQTRNVFCRPVKVDVASHSPQVDALTDDLLRELATIQPRKTKISLYSTVDADQIEEPLLDAYYWVRNLRCPVLFSRAVQKLADDGHTVFIELSPHPVLTAAIEETVTAAGRKLRAIPSLEREKDEQLTLLNSVGRLYTMGYSVDWARLFPFPGKVVPLPLYPWQRQRFWLQSEPQQPKNGSASFLPTAGKNHPLMGIRLPQVASLPASIIWQSETGEGSSPQSGTACIDMAAAAATEVYGPNLNRISDLKTYVMPGLVANSGARTQFILDTDGPNPASFQLFCQGSEPSGEWTKYASGKVEPQEAKADWIYELIWKEKALKHSAHEAPAGRWLIFADQGGIGVAAAAAMTSRGQDCVLVFAGESFEVQGPTRFCVAAQNPDHITQLLKLLAEDGQPSCRGILYLWGLDSLAAGCDGALRLIQSLARMEWNTAPRLWVATAGAQAVEPTDGECLSLEQAPLWGLARVIALEQPNLWGGMIDLPRLGNPTAANAGIAELCEELLASDSEDQVALRGNRRYVLRLERSRTAVVKKPFTLSPEATYLITGGLGSLGLHLARWLVARGVRHLVLTGRTGLPDRSMWPSIPAETEIGKRVAAVRALEENGATIHIAKADVADRREMSELWNKLDAHHPPVRGIIHAAGILRPSALVHLEPGEFHDVLRSKMDGASLLHELVQATTCRANALDFFVLFSSGASVWGSQGLAPYAAANHFLDALAQHRVALGLPALSVNWGWWEGEGIVSEELAARFRSIGMKGLPADGALAALVHLLETGAAQKTVADMDWSVFRPIFEARRKRPLLECLAAPPREAEPLKAREEKRHGPLQQIEQASASERKPMLHDYIRTQVAEILGFRSPDRVDPRQGFFRMGMDSIMTMQLRTRLETALDHSLPPTVAFEYPTVDSLVDFIAGMILEPEASAIRPVDAPEKQELSDVDIECEQLSEEELVALLERRLEQIR